MYRIYTHVVTYHNGHAKGKVMLKGMMNGGMIIGYWQHSQESTDKHYNGCKE